MSKNSKDSVLNYYEAYHRPNCSVEFDTNLVLHAFTYKERCRGKFTKEVLLRISERAPEGQILDWEKLYPLNREATGRPWCLKVDEMSKVSSNPVRTWQRYHNFALPEAIVDYQAQREWLSGD